MHGSSGAPRGYKNPLKHGLYTREAMEEPIQSDRPCVQVASAIGVVRRAEHGDEQLRRDRFTGRAAGSITSSVVLAYVRVSTADDEFRRAAEP